MPIDAPPSSRTTTDSGFGKVLNSIHGLQQRLDDFSIDEISNAHTTASALVQRLHECQRQLAALARLKEAVAAANAQINAMPDQDLELIAADGLERYSQLRAIVHVGKLIPLRRPLRELQASLDSASLPRIQWTSTAGSSSDQTTDESASAAPQSNEAQEVPAADASAAMGTPNSANDTMSHNSEGAKAANQPAFNERLLNDLIETYGEFTIIGPASKPDPSTTMLRPELLKIPEAPAGAPSQQNKSPEPAFVRSTTGGLLGLPPPQKKASKSPPSRPPKRKGQVEIDRQLKNIIKDYGEYDLYSPQKSTDLKAAALAAFVVLGLLIGGFYLW